MKYEVKVLEVHSVTVEVEANSPEEAQAKAEDRISNEILLENFERVYEYTLEYDEWPVYNLHDRLTGENLGSVRVSR